MFSGSGYKNSRGGFTLLELLITVAIIGIMASIALAALELSREKARDASRASQVQEFLKAAELYYTDTGVYPLDSIPDGGPALAFIEGSDPGNALKTSGYLGRVPRDPKYNAMDGYHYCASDSGDLMYIIVNTEKDKGPNKTDFCVVGRGPGAYTEPTCSVGGDMVNTLDQCSSRFK